MYFTFDKLCRYFVCIFSNLYKDSAEQMVQRYVADEKTEAQES